MEVQRVYAVGIAVGRGSLSEEQHQKIQDAMTRAVELAQAEGVADPAEIRRRVLAARDVARS